MERKVQITQWCAHTDKITKWEPLGIRYTVARKVIAFIVNSTRVLVIVVVVSQKTKSVRVGWRKTAP